MNNCKLIIQKYINKKNWTATTTQIQLVEDNIQLPYSIFYEIQVMNNIVNITKYINDNDVINTIYTRDFVDASAKNISDFFKEKEYVLIDFDEIIK